MKGTHAAETDVVIAVLRLDGNFEENGYANERGGLLVRTSVDRLAIHPGATSPVSHCFSVGICGTGPFPNIALHIEKSPPIGKLPGNLMRMTIGVPSIPKVAIVDLLSPVMPAPGAGPGGIFPFGIGRKAATHPSAEGLCIANRDIDHRLFIADFESR